MAHIRIFIDVKKISIGDLIDVGLEQSHYLINVMKQKKGDVVLCFNGIDGEFAVEILGVGKKYTSIRVLKKTRDFEIVPDLWLLFAPLKKNNTDFVIEKATELGVRKIVPVITKRSITDKVRIDRLKAQAIEASEQSRRVDVPEILEAVTLDKLLKSWDKTRILYFLDESRSGDKMQDVFASAKGPCAILVGPEGGFAPEEFEFLRKQSYTKAVDMGKRILRAETAAIAGVACWQATCGDWK